RQADRGRRSGELAGAESRGQAGRPREQGNGVAEDKVAGPAVAEPCGLRGARGWGDVGEQVAGEGVEALVVDVAGDDRDDGGVAGVAGRGGGAGAGPGGSVVAGEIIAVGVEAVPPASAGGPAAGGT